MLESTLVKGGPAVNGWCQWVEICVSPDVATYHHQKKNQKKINRHAFLTGQLSINIAGKLKYNRQR